jgi:small nuclear ribonucleoprotein (snRNP)-like protein
MRHYGFHKALIGGAAVLACLCLSAAWAGQVVMKNGDRVTGIVIKQDGKTVTIKTENFGVVSAPWDQVVWIQSDQPVTVVLKDGKSLEGSLSTVDGKVVVTGQNAKLEAAPAEVTAMRNADEQKAYERMLAPGLLELWSGEGTVGLAGAEGNAKTLTFTTGVTVARTTNKDKISLNFNAIKSSALVGGKDSATAQAVRGGIRYDRNVSLRFFVSTFNDYEYDKFQSLDLRFVAGGGLGWQAVKGARGVLSVIGGADYNHSSFSTPLTRSVAEAYWGDDYSLKPTKATSLVQSMRMFNDLTDRGEYRVNFDLGLSTRVLKRITWNLSLSDRYLSDPVPGRKSNDWLYTTGVGLTFGK